MIGKAHFEAAHGGEGCEIGQAAQTKEHSAHRIELTGNFSKQPPVCTEKQKNKLSAEKITWATWKSAGKLVIDSYGWTAQPWISSYTDT